jgi:hypothetical protein
MTDRKGDQPQSRRGQTSQHIWVCTYEHSEGLDVWACESEELALRELGALARRHWEAALDAHRRFTVGGETPLAALPPDDDRTAVEAYFDVMNDADPPEFCTVVAYGLISEGGRR